MRAQNLEAVDLSPHPPALWRQLQWTSKLVMGVKSGRSLASEIDRVPNALRSGVQALTFHALRHLGTATAVCEQLVARRPPAEVDALLLTSIALMLPMSGAPYAAHTLVDQAVEAAKRGQSTRNQAGRGWRRSSSSAPPASPGSSPGPR